VLRRALIPALILLALLVAGCGEKDEPDIKGPAVPIDQPNEPDQPNTASVRLQRIGQFDQPVYVTQPAGEKDLFVVEQTGRIQRVGADGGPSRTFLDISRQVSCCGEQGLLSMAFSPDYKRDHLFYVDYTNKAGDTRVVEFEVKKGAPDAGGDVADPKSARTLLSVAQPFPNHNGGLLQFGPDGDLYIGLGDGGSADDPKRNGQDLGTDLGKILRIDPKPSVTKVKGQTKKKFKRQPLIHEPYTVPKSNPFVDRKGAKPEIYSYGLRNPWRFSFDSKTGALWIGDVGQDTLEEVDGVAKGDGSGANFGWSAFEGTNRFNKDQKAPGAVKPVLTYGRDQGCSVTGGYVVRDRALTSLYGRYIYGDFCQGELRSFTATPGHRATDDAPVGLQVPSLSSFGEDQAGHLYALSIEGPLYRIVAGN
jgi:glucose/arabinose dehydrogenase